MLSVDREQFLVAVQPGIDVGLGLPPCLAVGVVVGALCQVPVGIHHAEVVALIVGHIVTGAPEAVEISAGKAHHHQRVALRNLPVAAVTANGRHAIACGLAGHHLPHGLIENGLQQVAAAVVGHRVLVAVVEDYRHGLSAVVVVDTADSARGVGRHPPGIVVTQFGLFVDSGACAALEGCGVVAFVGEADRTVARMCDGDDVEVAEGLGARGQAPGDAFAHQALYVATGVIFVGAGEVPPGCARIPRPDKAPHGVVGIVIAVSVPDTRGNKAVEARCGSVGVEHRFGECPAGIAESADVHPSVYIVGRGYRGVGAQRGARYAPGAVVGHGDAGRVGKLLRGEAAVGCHGGCLNAAESASDGAGGLAYLS